jgi:predicted TIM-barrel fold metal-dependent hydrolase
VFKLQIIDCHANVGWDVSNLRKNLYPVDQNYTKLLEKMDTYDVSKAVILPFPSPGAQFSENTFWYETENQYLVEAQNFSKRLNPFPGVNPKDKQSVKNIQVMATAFNVKGIKFSHQSIMGFPIDKLIGHPLLKIVHSNSLLFMIHVGTGKEPGSHEVHTTLDYAVKVARHYPDIQFVLCHLGRLHVSMMEALNLENVHMDTSALSMMGRWKEFLALEPLHIFERLNPNEVIEKLVDMGHEDKLIFGSDIPYRRYKEELDCILSAQISESVKRKIFCGNIKKLVRI